MAFVPEPRIPEIVARAMIDPCPDHIVIMEGSGRAG